MAKTPTRTIRVSETLWQDAKVQAAIDGLTLTDVILEHLMSYTSNLRAERENVAAPTGTEGLW